MKNILIVLGHPDTSSLCGAMADSYAKGAKSSKYKLKRLNLSDLKFDPILHNGYNKIQNLEPDLISAQKQILWADHIVWIFPTWWGSMPALLKGFIDRVFLPGFAFKYTGPNTWNRLLSKKTARIITTMGGQSLFYKIMGAPGIRAFKYITLIFCGISPVKVSMYGAIRHSTPVSRINTLLIKVERLGNKGK